MLCSFVLSVHLVEISQTETPSFSSLCTKIFGESVVYNEQVKMSFKKVSLLNRMFSCFRECDFFYFIGAVISAIFI